MDIKEDDITLIMLALYFLMQDSNNKHPKSSTDKEELIELLLERANE